MKRPGELHEGQTQDSLFICILTVKTGVKLTLFTHVLLSFSYIPGCTQMSS